MSESAMETGGQLPTTISGSLRPLPASPGVRLAQAALGLLFFRGLVRGFASAALGYRHTATLSLQPGELVVRSEKQLLGRRWGGSERRLALPLLTEIALEEYGQDPRFTAGLVTLGLGTFFGIFVFSQGLSRAGTSPSLLGFGALIFAAGLAFDYLLGSGRGPRDIAGPAQLVIQSTADRGWVIGKLKQSEARSFLQRLKEQLSSQQS